MRCFADSFYFLAFLNRDDDAHLRAREIGQRIQKLITTDWVVTEVADAMAGARNRRAFLSYLRALQGDPDATVIPADRKHFEAGLHLYARRLDKDWTLTDCISFVVMQEQQITEALTADHHFEQAGFVALLK
jgi:uncharacterized protein